MNESSLKQELLVGLAELERLAMADYAQRLLSLVGKNTDSPATTILRIGRLMGVSMKEPFSTSRRRPKPTRDTGSKRAWTLAPDLLLRAAGKHKSWQYATLNAMASEFGISPSEMATLLRRERNFFGFLAMSVHKYICGDPKIRAKVQKNVAVARGAGLTLKVQAPEVMVAASGVALGSYLVSIAPLLGYVGAPVIAGMVLVLYTVGVDAFCNWVVAQSGGVA